MKKLPLTRGLFALVDDDDFDFLNQWKWSASQGRGPVYATRGTSGKNKKRQAFMMHRVIMNTPKGLYVDHINHNGLDNRKINLRNCTREENMRNRKANSQSQSGFKGVCWSVESKKWQVQIKFHGVARFLGFFSNKIEAAKAYDEAAIKYFGEFAMVNFPKRNKSRLSARRDLPRLRADDG